MKRKISCKIKSFSHDHYLVFKNGDYQITNQPHYYGNLEFKFDDSELKKIKFISKNDKILNLSVKTNLKPEDIIKNYQSEIQYSFEENKNIFQKK
jgi:hypothetical protein